MKILIYSRAFWPSIGGIETVSQTLASWLAENGHGCAVLTETPAALESDRKFAFHVVRRPSIGKRLSLFRWADIVHSNGASLHAFVWAKCVGKPIIWTHAGYQLTCIDGSGWCAGAPAPMSPLASAWLHAQKRGSFLAMRDAIKLYLRRWASRHVNLNVAITEWVARRQPLRRQVVIHNPFPLSFWRSASRSAHREHDFVFLGRLVSEKGVDTLLRALSRTVQLRKASATLCVIGDGPERERLEKLARELGIARYVTFTGALSGQLLLDAVARSRIAVVPSVLEEPMGGVALELMAAGKALVVSEKGGLAECCGPAALAFPNGDVDALAKALCDLLDSPQRVERLQEEACDRLTLFNERKLCERYEAVYASILRA